MMNLWTDTHLEFTKLQALIWAARETEDDWDRDIFFELIDEVSKSVERKLVQLSEKIA